MKILKNLFLIALGSAVTASSANASLIAYEGFNYDGTPAATSIHGLNGGTGWTSAWLEHSGSQTTPLLLGSSAMTYDTLSVSGTSAGTVTSTGDPTTPAGELFYNGGARRQFSSTDITSGALYFSAITQGYFGANRQVFRIAGSNETLDGADLSVWFDDNAVGISNGWTGDPSSVGTYSGNTSVADDQVTNMFVLKYDFSTTEATLYLNPTIGATEAASSIAATLDFTTGIAGLGTFGLFNRINHGTFDEVRIASSWEGATAVPEPSNYAILAGALALGGAMIRRRR